MAIGPEGVRLDENPTTTAVAAADRAVVARMASGDASAVTYLYDAHARAVYSLACRMLSHPQDAEDVVQEVFAQVWRQAGRYDARRASVLGWLLMIARTRALDRLRARRSRPAGESLGESPADDRPDPVAGPESSVIAAEAEARLRSAVRLLTAPQRLAIELAFYEGLTHADIAERLGEPMGTIKTRIRSGLLKLRSALAGE